MAEVIWQEAAQQHLRSIHSYLFHHSSPSVAAKIMYHYENDQCNILAIWNTKRDAADKIEVVLHGYSN